MCLKVIENGAGCPRTHELAGMLWRISAGPGRSLVMEVCLNFIKASGMEIFMAFALLKAFLNFLTYLFIKLFE